MRTETLQFIALAAGLSVAGCSEPETSSADGYGGALAVGGAASNGTSVSAGGATQASGTEIATGGNTTAAVGGSGLGSAGTTAAAASGGTTGTGGTTSTTLPRFVGNITTNNSVDTGGMAFSKYWNQITPENAGKWGCVQSTPTSDFNWTTLDAIYAYAQTNNLIFKQHTFVWGSQQPSGTPTLAQVETWISSFCARYPNTKLIDVVNEPPPHTTPTYTASLGAGESGSYPWITKAFKLARQYCGSAILILNDYNNIEYADQEQHFIDIVTDIKAAGAPIDAVGAQAHGIYSFTAAVAQANIDTLASGTGLPVYITEYDVPKAADDEQLAIFQAQFPVFWNTASVKGITIWGWISGSTWSTSQGLENTGLVNVATNGTVTPRSAMTWLMDYLGRPIPPN